MENILDLKDRRLLYELDKDARQSNTQLAKRTGISKQVAGFRIKRLLKENIISKFYTIIDISKLGFAIHKNFLRLQNLDEKKEHELIHYLVSNPDVVWVAGCDGRYDLAFGTWAENVESLDHTLKELNKRFGKYISERQIATILRGEYLLRNYLLNKPRAVTYHESSFGAVPSLTKIDEIDWKILKELGEDARKTAVEISKKVNISAETTSDRIRKLENSQVIRGYNIVPNEEKFPYLHYKVLLGMKNTSEEKERAFISYCRNNAHIVYTVKALGPWEFEIDIEVENAKHLRSIMMDIKTKFSDILKDYSTLSIYQVYKYNFCPSIKYK